MRRISLSILLVAVILGGPVRAEPIEVTAHPFGSFAIASSEQQFGPLEFRGGVELVSSDPRFGGISGIEVVDGGNRALLVTDSGHLVRLTLNYSDDRLVGAADGSIDRLLANGDRSKEDNDVEDFALDPADPEQGAIVLERQKKALMSFTMADGVPGGFEAIPVPADSRLLRSNKGLESVAFAPPSSPAAGRIIVIAEHARKHNPGMIPGWIIGEGEFHVIQRDDFDVSSARFLPVGDLLLLERRYTPGWGVAMRLRRVPAAEVVPGAKLDGEILLESGMLHQIDNMEGLSVHEDTDGRSILTLVSDDNKSFLQRTLILQFALSP